MHSSRFYSKIIPDGRTCAKRILQIQHPETGNERSPREFGIRYQNTFYDSQRS